MAKKNLRLDKFIKEYSASGNAYQSAIKAGYSKSYAKARCADLVRQATPALKASAAQEEKKIGLTREDKKIFLKELIDKVKIGEADPNVALKAIDIDNKMDGEYITKQEVSGNVALKFGWEDDDEDG